MAIQKGTGFTNLNKILQANKGNKLGQTVSGGISGQAQGVNTQVKSAQEQFQEEANKNRLDTQEAANKRQGVLGRFDQTSYTPDMSKFQASSGLQQGFDTAKQARTTALSQQAQSDAAKRQQYQTDLQAAQKKLTSTPQKITTTGTAQFDYGGGSPGVASATINNPEYQKLQEQISGLQSNLSGLSNFQQGESGEYDFSGDQQLKDLQSQYDKNLEAERQAYIKSEQQRMLNESLPTDQEIQDFTKYRTGTYTGPKQLEDYGSLFSKAAQAESLGQLSRSEGGRQELLRRFVGGTGYTPGQQRLDATILGQQPGQLAQAARETRGATRAVDVANRQAANLAQEYVGRAKQFGEETGQMIGEKKTPLSEDLNARLTAAQEAETARLNQFKQLQDVLSGQGEFGGLDQWTRAGLALQDAANKGILSPSDAAMLIGQGDKIGLLQRGANLGLDMNKLLSERFTNTIAQNLSRTGLASPEDIARLNALDKLAGKTGTDLEFLQGQGQFAAGKTGFDTANLLDYITKSEAEKASKDKAYADRLAAEQARYMNQIQSGLEQGVSGTQQAIGGALGPLEMLSDPTDIGNIMGGSLANISQGGLNAVAGATSAGLQTPAAILEGVAKLNIGGNSIANTKGGQELLKMINYYSKLANVTPSALMDLGTMYKDTWSDLGRGNIVGAVGSLGGGVAKTLGNAVKNITGSGIKISDEDLKTDIDYTQQDVQRFMDRIKPASYDYKDEVKNSPLASKNRELGVMAQDLEKSKLGKEAVHDTDVGKVVDYDNLEPKMLASIAALNKRLKELENKK